MQLPRTSELQLQTTHRNLCSITLPQNSSTIVMDLEDQDLLLEDDEVEQDYTYFLRQYLEEEDRLEDDDGDGVVHLAEPSLHTYLGEIEDTRHRTAFLDGNSVVNLSRFRLQGISLLSVFMLLLLFIVVHNQGIYILILHEDLKALAQW
ncbi:uncharacterized protein LOC110272244 isoform X3 [Arachis ipaensis]|nr:uncharacterized protein LOC110272244 isoform X3 [Arachis ipaensis]QHO12396.1 uncharacterized protein DS421_15g506580 [Arachis hypogaea]QHO12397.1 uncharacterized protein DS421_15g506580 [Arachis hypogaea]